MSSAQPTTQLVSSVPLNAGQFAVSLMCRFLQGLSASTVILLAIDPDMDIFATDALVFAITCLTVAAVLCGAGLNTSLERLLSSMLGVRTGCLAAALFPIFAMSVLSDDGSYQPPLFAGLLVGLGIGSDWSTVAEVARRGLPTKVRWQGMRVWTVAFPAGAAAAILLHHDFPIVFNVTVGLSSLIICLLLFIKPTPHRVPMEQTAGPSATEQSPKPQTTPEIPKPTDDAEECDAEECCGGGVRDVRPTSFWHGVVLAAAGTLCLYTTMCLICTSQYYQYDGALAAFAIGLPVGSLLIVTVAPRVGYVVALLPFLLFGALSVSAIWWLPFDSRWLSFATFCCGLFSAAAACGISSVIGELFSDCPADAKRSRVLSVALFASAAMMVSLGLLRMWIQSVEASAIASAAVFLVGLLVVRCLPTPVISSLGKDDDNNSDDEELNDVIAAINN